MIPQEEMVERGVYTLKSRNLVVGVWNGASGFIGIRLKFRSEYLFTEYHYDQGAPYGTAKPQVLLGVLPKGIEPRERLETEEITRIMGWRIKGIGEVDPVDGDQLYWSNEDGWVYKDDSMWITLSEKEADPCLPLGGEWEAQERTAACWSNEALFNFLKPIDKMLIKASNAEWE
jgi:hypothetical protein